MALLPIFYQILVLFMVLLVGFIIYRLKIVDDNMISGLSRLVMDITLPALIITSMSFDFSREILNETVQLIFLSLGLYILSWFISILVVKAMKLSGKTKDIFQFMLIFSNVGFMGYPVINAIYGRIGVFYTSLYNFTYGLLVWTLGVWIFRRNEGNKVSFQWKAVLTPGFVAVILGLGVFLFSIKLPQPIYQTLEMIGGMTTPLSMLAIGAIMGRSTVKGLWKNYRIYLVSLIRLLAIPLIVLVITVLFRLSPLITGVSVVLMGMPAAANTAIFAERFGGDADYAAQIVFLSTLFSIITIPGLVLLLNL